MALVLRSLILVAILAASAASAQTWPTRPIQVIVPWPAGGGTDLIARAVMTRVQPRLGQPIVIENRPGASGIIGTKAAATAAADGYTFVVGVTNTHGINPSFFKKLPYDAMSDFQPVTLLAIGPHVLLVNAALPVKSVQELVELVRSEPGKHNFASYGNGSTAHLAGQSLKDATGVNIVHVPYKGIPPALTDLLGGQVTMLFSTTAAAMPHIKAGKLRALAVTDSRRLDALPDVPTMAELGFKDAVLTHWYGLLAPAGTPRAMVDRMAKEVAAVLALPELQETFAQYGVVPAPMSPETYAAFIREEIVRWGTLVRASGATGD
jgi:tripartite-type tricarboxylate transporter receptor subunit TctC